RSLPLNRGRLRRTRRREADRPASYRRHTAQDLTEVGPVSPGSLMAEVSQNSKGSPSAISEVSALEGRLASTTMSLPKAAVLTPPPINFSPGAQVATAR